MKFQLSDKEQKLANEWISKQKKKDNTQTTFGGRFSYKFTQTGIGVVVEVIDEHLNESLDVTDYDLW